MTLATIEPNWVGADEGTGGHFVAKRVITYRVWIASELTSSIGQDQAHDALKKKLVDDGLLTDRLKDALIAEFNARTGVTV